MAKERGAKKPREQIAVRLLPEEIERVEALRARLSTPWHEATRSDALRAVILRGLAAMENEEQEPPG